ncbi:hypothetical protein HanPSC8_Chr12g0528881 [Helianthus annuus]|nr:hypothetical protein HanPSC8_Chr12g0528881 [Helianthus annuus]
MEEHLFHVCNNYDCDERVTYPVARFKIKVQVEDISDDVPIILFHPLADEIIEKVVLKSADQLLQENTTSGNNKEFIKRKSHIPSVKNDDANTSSDINKINKRKLVDVYNSSTPSNVKDLEKVRKKET